MNRRSITGYILLSLLLLILFCLNLFSGTTSGTLQHLLSDTKDPMLLRILTEIRLPRTLAAALLGSALACSGFLLQSYFANPIAGPFILGISSGAKLTVALTLIAAVQTGQTLHAAGLVLAAFIGALAAMTVVLGAASRVRSMSVLVVCGVMIGYFCSAVTDLLLNLSDDSSIVNLHSWSMGSFSGTSMKDAAVIAAVVLPALVSSFLLAKPMLLYLLGEDYARSAGVHIRAFRIALILLSSLLAACVTAFAGPVSFVGVAVPHLMRRLLKTSDPRLLLPACILGGADFCLICDWCSRMLFAPTELSISTVTAFLGAPILITMLLQRNHPASHHHAL